MSILDLYSPGSTPTTTTAPDPLDTGISAQLSKATANLNDAFKSLGVNQSTAITGGELSGGGSASQPIQDLWNHYLRLGPNLDLTNGGDTGSPSSTASGDTWWDKILGIIPGGSTVSSAVKTASWFANLDLTQVVSIVLGLILIIGGIYFFKPVQQAVTTTVKHGAKAAELLSA